MPSDTNENKVTALLELTSDYDVGCHNDFYVMQILSCLYSLVVNLCEWGKRKQNRKKCIPYVTISTYPLTLRISKS